MSGLAIAIAAARIAIGVPLAIWGLWWICREIGRIGQRRP